MNSLFNKFKPISKKKTQASNNQSAAARASDIGQPYSVKHNIHVGYNPETKKIEGLPQPWIELLHHANISKKDQANNPTAVIEALKYWTDYINQKPGKIMLITKEDEQGSGSGSDYSGRSSQEDNLSEDNFSGKKENKEAPVNEMLTMDENKNKDKKKKEIIEEPPILPLKDKDYAVMNGDKKCPDPLLLTTPPVRRKKPGHVANRISDEDVLLALKKVINPGDPKLRFQLLNKIGFGASGTVYTAVDNQTQKRVAIKTMDLAQQPKKELIITEIMVMRENQYVIIFTANYNLIISFLGIQIWLIILTVI